MESNLADTYHDILGGVAFDLGFVRSLNFVEDTFQTRYPDKHANLKMAIKGGLQQFYNPPPDQSGVSYQWSFLKPLGTITIVSGSKTVRLPYDFKGVEGKIHVMRDNGGYSLPVSANVRAKYAAYPDDEGEPRMIEIEPLDNPDKEHGQRSQFVVWPEADADYELQFNYSIQGKMLSGDLPYAYGGAEHSSTIRASCLAWAELHFDDIANGPKAMFWRERLAASISMDRQKQPQTVGYNGDSSDLRGWYSNNRRDPMRAYPLLEYDGQVWE